jgi:hypothetical protein
MNDRETRRYQMFGRVQTFGKNNTTDFAAGGEAAKRFTNLGKIIKDLDAAKATQQPGTATAKDVLLDALRLDLQNIARTARAMEQDEPGFAAKYRVPESHSDLLTAADAIIIELKKAGVAAKFIAQELPADFVQHLVDDRQTIDDAQDAEESDDSEGVESTAAIGRLIREGMKEVNYLNAIMHNKYSRNAEKLRAWQSASHIERAPQREKKPAPAKTPAP